MAALEATRKAEIPRIILVPVFIRNIAEDGAIVQPSMIAIVSQQPHRMEEWKRGILFNLSAQDIVQSAIVRT